MEAREARPRILPIRSDDANFSWTNWKTLFNGHMGMTPGVQEVLNKVPPANETPAAKTTRLRNDFAHNATALSYLYEACQSDKVALGVLTAQSAVEAQPSANNLLRLLDNRFNQRRDDKVQALLGQFN